MSDPEEFNAEPAPPPPAAGVSSATIRSASWIARLQIPREHGAWGMVSLPFIAGALVAGGWANLRTLAAMLAVLSIFLLRSPLLTLWRSRVANRAVRARDRGPRDARAEQDIGNARFSLSVYIPIAALSGGYLLLTLPLVPLLLMGWGAVLLTLAILYFAARNYQRYPVLQMASAVGLTASVLPAYLAAHGNLDAVAFWIWALCAAHNSTSVLVVHAQLESIIARRKRETGVSPFPHRRNAVVAEAGLWLLVAVLVFQGKAWLAIPFIPPCLLHACDLWQLGSKSPLQISIRRVGLLQLGASIAFCFLLLMVLRSFPL